MATALPPQEESKYRGWLKQIGQTPGSGYNIDDNWNGTDYDYRGFYKKYGPADIKQGQHFTDEFKLPNHPTFSNESIYATGEDAKRAGSWDGDNFVPPQKAGMNISTIRQKYPQYQDLSDEQLVEGLHKKFYSDMPLENFAQRVGYQAKADSNAPSTDTTVPKEEGMGSYLKRELSPENVASAIVRPAVKAITAVPGVFADGAMGAWNLATGQNNELPSQATERVLDQYTRKPEGVGKAAEFVSSTVLGSRVLPGPKPAQAQPVVKQPSQAAAVIAEGEKHGVPVFFDDVSQNAVARRVGVAAESLGPLGTGAGRAAQQTAAKDAALRVADRLAPNTSDDVPLLVQQGLKAKLGSFRKTAGKLYTRAAQELDPKGDVPLTGLDNVITTEAARQTKLGTLASDDVAALLDKYKNAPRGNFSLMREMRSQLSEDISDFYTGKNVAIGERGVTALRSMKEALDDDLAGFAQKVGGNGYGSWRAADGFYKANLVPFKEAGFRDLVKTAEPEKAWNYLIAQGGLKSRAARMYNSLDESGRSSVRYGLVKDAMDRAVDPKGVFSPAKFAKYFEDHDQTVTTFFKGSDLREIQGFQNLMRHVERAGQYAENPPTGQRLIPYLFGGAAFVSPGAAAGVAGSGVTVRALFQTKTGRNLLLAMSHTKPGTKPAQALTSRIGRYLASASAVAATGKPETSPEEATEE